MVAQLVDKESFRQGSAAWNKYVGENSHRFNLTFLEPDTKVLLGYRFSNCDFTAARLEGVIFESCEFFDCDLSGANLQGADFRNCSINSTLLEGAILERCTFSKSRVSGLQLNTTAFSGLRFLESDLSDLIISGGECKTLELRNCAVKDLILRDLELLECRFLRLKAHTLSFQDCRMKSLSFLASSFTEGSFKNSVLEFDIFDGNDFANCVFSEVDVHAKSSGSKNSFFECRFSLMQLKDLGLEASPALGCAFIDCEWLSQQGTIGIFGGYWPAKALIKQPVQDVYGVDPRLRREISDAQFLRQLNLELKGFKKIGFRVWGATVGYGLRFGRLCITTLFFYVVAVATFFLIHSSEAGAFEFVSAIGLASQDALVAMFSLAGEQPEANRAHSLVTTVFRISGFLVLGLWVNLVSNRLVRLGT